MKGYYKVCLALFILICILGYKLLNTNYEGYRGAHHKKYHTNITNNTSTGSNKIKLSKR